MKKKLQWIDGYLAADSDSKEVVAGHTALNTVISQGRWKSQA